MANHIFKLGSLDLSEFLRVNPGDGLEPADSDYVEPQFSESPLREGGALVNEDVNNKEQVWPLFLGTRVNATRELVNAHREAIQAELRKPRCKVEWREPGADESTFYDVEAGRLEEDYNIRVTGKGRAKALLRTWVRPYGHTGLNTQVADGTASGIGYLAPASVIGDIPALVQYGIGQPGGASGAPQIGEGYVAAVAAIPSGYQWRHPAASIVGLTEVGASWAAGSQAGVMEDTQSVGLAPASIYRGRSHRVLAAVRTGPAGFDFPQDAFRAFFDGQPIGPTALATARGPALVDLGVVRVPDSYAGPTITVEIQKKGLVRSRLDSLQTADIDRGCPTTMLNEIYVLPEDALSVAQVPRRTPRAFDNWWDRRTLDTNATILLNGELESYGNQWSVPTLNSSFTATSPYVTVLGGKAAVEQQASGFQTAVGALMDIEAEDLTIRANVVASPMFSFATTGSASAGLGVFLADKDSGETPFHQAFAAIKGGAQRSLSVSYGSFNVSGGGGNNLLASMGLASPLAGMNLIFRKQGLRVTAIARSNASPMIRVLTAAGAATFMPFASVGGQLLNHFDKVSPGLFMRATRGICGIYDFTVTEVPSMMQRTDAQIFWDNLEGEDTVYMYDTNSDAVVHIEHLTRGRIPKLGPDDYGVVLLAQSLEHEDSNRVLPFFVGVRERFSYAR